MEQNKKDAFAVWSRLSMPFGVVSCHGPARLAAVKGDCNDSDHRSKWKRRS